MNHSHVISPMRFLHLHHLEEHAKHNPGLLIIDKPLLGLDDPQENPELAIYYDKIPEALYEYLTLYPERGQIIIVDNTKYMPDLSLLKGKANLIHFTKNEHKGRYGFLIGYTDTTITSTPPETETEETNEQ